MHSCLVAEHYGNTSEVTVRSSPGEARGEKSSRSQADLRERQVVPAEVPGDLVSPIRGQMITTADLSCTQSESIF